jgi:hypothetical protein
MLDVFLEGLSFLLNNAGYVPVDSQPRACGTEVAGEQPAYVVPRLN